MKEDLSSTAGPLLQIHIGSTRPTRIGPILNEPHHPKLRNYTHQHTRDVNIPFAAQKLTEDKRVAPDPGLDQAAVLMLDEPARLTGLLRSGFRHQLTPGFRHSRSRRSAFLCAIWCLVSSEMSAPSKNGRAPSLPTKG
ncbi:hypothetical protein GCM10009839_43400 [Catenulispora yoronensis]|uniref:Uncharacterized protein n=1 Tax=Catenulispora yoronensis TaxID=450799 RepID=A0ABN2UH03_9ACTN